jgi:hypothetical protein
MERIGDRVEALEGGTLDGFIEDAEGFFGRERRQRSDEKKGQFAYRDLAILFGNSKCVCGASALGGRRSACEPR